MAALSDDRFAKAEALQANLNSKSPPKLEILCFDFFISLAENIISEWKKSGENAFDQLPGILRNEMLNYLPPIAHQKNRNIRVQMRKQLCQLTCMLMNETTMKLDYADCSSYTNWLFKTAYVTFGEILARAAVKSPKLKHLAFRDCKERITPLICGTKNAMKMGSGIDHLLQLEQLRHLDIFGLWYWTDEGLNKLFSNLKKLITLKILIHSNASVSGIQELKELEEFHFVVGKPSDIFSFSNHFARHYELIYNYCAENLPSLKLIGAPTNDCADDNNLDYCPDLRHITPKIKGISNLEHLHSKSTLPEAEFPNLQHLYFSGPISSDVNVQFFQKFGTFTHLTSLILGQLTSDVIAKMLELVGTQLKTLSIFKGEAVDLFQIFHLCPNLVKFKHSNSGNNEMLNEVFHPSKYEALVTEHNVRFLEYFQANFDGRHGGKDRLFELILLAPLMKDLSLTSISMTKTQCQLFHDVEEGKLRELKCLILSSMQLDPTCSWDDFDLFVQCLVCSAPCLSYFNFTQSSFSQEISDNWDLSQTVARSFQKLVNKDRETGARSHAFYRKFL